ncbi:hypothetical protein LOD99_9615 [Oopsacas minuta]|uniref:HMG box domain-containing protein n=1 Tax=Oopsacas minuta TaxID=111878 RepID=A0AAV7KL54_9METZ|nr:hypothetical protein LOD99_9615 [Oopsacas minuta]
MKTVRTFTSIVRVYTRFIHNTVVLSAPIQKKPANSYARFVKDMYHEFSQSEEKAKAPRVMSMIANKWKTMTEEEKEKYTLAYEEDKKEWLKNYENTTDEEKVAYKEKKILQKEIFKNSSMYKQKMIEAEARKKFLNIDSRSIYIFERYHYIRKEFSKLNQKEIMKLMMYELSKLDELQKRRLENIASAIRVKAKENKLPLIFNDLYDECYLPRLGESIMIKK